MRAYAHWKMLSNVHSPSALRNALFVLTIMGVSHANAASYFFPVASINASAAPNVSLYEVPSTAVPLDYDFHPVHGVDISGTGNALNG